MALQQSRYLNEIVAVFQNVLTVTKSNLKINPGLI